ncbi:MAG TPA: hypothetical protein VEF04_04820 [Blastocatellia bacterium]|nr:hypothetical protein [Blastocatellia bacterium]
MTRSKEIARKTWQDMNKRVEEFIAYFLANYATDPAKDAWEQLPKAFSISTKEWLEMERQIEDAVAEDDEPKVRVLCDEYSKRVNSYISTWRQRITVKKAA